MKNIFCNYIHFNCVKHIGQCSCDAGYSSAVSGEYCDTEDTCGDIGACLNGGSCVNGNCLCDTDYTGFNCESKAKRRQIKIHTISFLLFNSELFSCFYLVPVNIAIKGFRTSI